MSGYQFIATRRDGHTLILTLNRPEVMNALHSPAHFECHEALNAFAADDDAWVAIITGAGDRAFCAGNDLKHHAAGGSLEMPPSGFGGVTSRFDLDKPLIAAVNGMALGGGFEMALACDVIVAAQNAKFGLPEPKVGLAALAGGLHRLPRAIGMNRAMAMIISTRIVTAEDGARLGFVDQVTAAGGALEGAMGLAEDILKCGPLAIRAAKQAVLRGADLPLEEALRAQWGWPAVQAMRASKDATEGPRAFAEKRPPRWTGL